MIDLYNHLTFNQNDSSISGILEVCSPTLQKNTYNNKPFCRFHYPTFFLHSASGTPMENKQKKEFVIVHRSYAK